MIDIEKAKKEFLKYTEKFDTKNPKIKGKVHHSIRVMEISKHISGSLNFNEEEIKLAELIGLLHDIGRFEQYTKYKTFRDIDSVDHGKLGVEILEKKKRIRNFVNDSQYDVIIKKAIMNHNQYGLEEGLSEQEEIYSKIIKDADKLDIFYEATGMFWKNQEEKIENEKISKEVYNEFKNGKLLRNEIKNSELDNIIGIVSFIYDINLKSSLEILEKEDYINKMIKRFNFKDEETKEKILEIQEIAEEYMKKRLKS